MRHNNTRASCRPPGRHASVGLAVAALLAICVSTALAQRQPTTVQLPTRSAFGTNSSVLVPDRGSAALGGVRRSAEGRTEIGAPLLPKQRGIGRTTEASGVSASVYIHDFEALEAELLGSLPPKETASATREEATALRGVAGAVTVPRDEPLPSVAAIRAERARQKRIEAEEAKTFFQRGQAAEEAGNRTTAIALYQKAARRAEGPLKARSEAAVARLVKPRANSVAFPPPTP